MSARGSGLSRRWSTRPHRASRRGCASPAQMTTLRGSRWRSSGTTRSTVGFWRKRLPRVNLFIADDTGLGKTIEAGLIARELLLRRKAKTIVAAVPPSVLEQWKSELEDRFGLVFVILDRGYVSRMRRERGFGVNLWRTHSRFLVSHNLLIDPAYADPMREWLGSMSPGSLLILDEAHHAAPSSGGRYGIETVLIRISETESAYRRWC